LVDQKRQISIDLSLVFRPKYLILFLRRKQPCYYFFSFSNPCIDASLISNGILKDDLVVRTPGSNM